MKYLLDSDTISAVFDPKSPLFNQAKIHLENLSEQDEICVSILSIYELEFSFSNAKTEEVREKITHLIHDLTELLEVLPLTIKGASFYGQLKSGFQKKTGTNRKAIRRHNIDIMIASVALDQDCTLVARDSIYKDHLVSIIPQLTVEDWTE